MLLSNLSENMSINVCHCWFCLVGIPVSILGTSRCRQGLSRPWPVSWTWLTTLHWLGFGFFFQIDQQVIFCESEKDGWLCSLPATSVVNFKFLMFLFIYAASFSSLPMQSLNQSLTSWGGKHCPYLSYLDSSFIFTSTSVYVHCSKCFISCEAH